MFMMDCWLLFIKRTLLFHNAQHMLQVDQEYHILCALNPDISTALGSFPFVLGPFIGPGVPSPRKTAMHFQLSR